MQVSLDPIDWNKLTRFASVGEYFEWAYGNDGDALPDGYAPDDAGPWSDSAMQYFDVAEALTHVQQLIGEPMATHLAHGLGRVLCENGHVDEYQTGPASENHYWISASPATTKAIWEHVRQTDWPAVCDALRSHPLTVGNMHDRIDTVFMPVIEQHVQVVEYAATHGHGLMGHCG